MSSYSDDENEDQPIGRSRAGTMEKPPKIDHYRKNSSLNNNAVNVAIRPSIMELLYGTSQTATVLEMNKNIVITKDMGTTSIAPVKLGWIQGVFVRCVLNILGVMLYLRISWVAGQAGLLFGTLIIFLACTVTTLTAISMCTICTNGYVKGGGLYFLISRSLGAEVGGAIGMIFALANAVAAAMYIVGFAETIRDLMKDNEVAIFDNGLNDIRVIGLVTCTILMGIVLIGTGFESKMQLGLMVILSASLISFIIGTFMPVTKEQNVRGITGYSWTTLTANLLPAWRGESFFSVFGVFFPAATGIMAGANISGDLKNPQTAIPKGTLLATILTTFIYMGTVWITGTTTVRDATGDGPLMYSNMTFEYITPPCADNGTCEFGLMNYFQVMEIESAWGPLITAGIFAATLSSALASLVSAPKIFQAVCKDRLFPYVDYFSKGYGANDEPRRAYGLAFAIAMAMTLIGDLNLIAPIISNFFLAAYALINYSCFDASISHSPGFRPKFKYYNKWVSLIAAVLCLTVMFIISWWTALITILFFFFLSVYIKHRKPNANWGSSTQANKYKSAFNGMLTLTKTEEHVKNYRPQLLVMTGNPKTRKPLLNFAYNITKGNSLIVCGHVIPYEATENVFSKVKKLNSELNAWLLYSQKIKAFYNAVANMSLRLGTQSLMQTSGLGKLRPNILLLGFKSNWHKNGSEGLREIDDYVGLIRDAFDCGMGVGILRNGEEGLDCSHLMLLPNTTEIKIDNAQSKQLVKSNMSEHKLKSSASISSLMMSILHKHGKTQEHRDFNRDENDLNIMAVLKEESKNAKMLTEAALLIQPNIDNGESNRTNTKLNAMQTEVNSLIDRFHRNHKEKKAVIDVWWLYDDGGLTLLISHLLSLQKSYLEGAKLRVFTIANSPSAIEEEQRNMVLLLNQFRIKCDEVFVVHDIAKEPSNTTVNEFQQLIQPFRTNSNDSLKSMISDEDLAVQTRHTNRQLRCRELLLQHSANAQLIVLTLPMPRKAVTSSCLYMAWLDILTHGMPPTLLIRGNQTSVLTFYS